MLEATSKPTEAGVQVHAGHQHLGQGDVTTETSEKRRKGPFQLQGLLANCGEAH